ncbi:hypothetical protein E1091_00140 [Micromonospora fluostatini]|uniref:Uncharacterized protein n=1 Tax=Micromonospora fluostatini TaxID=1629071 RepID=A0ABY2DMT3_9ACTN|nr:hypothetical protein E1091_00140 [Micromonospora fluostatini]
MAIVLYAAVLEVRDGSGWAPSAPIEIKADEGTSPAEAGADFMATRKPRGRWRLRVWVGDRVRLAAPPAATVTAETLAAAERGEVPVARASRRHHPVRVSGPVSAVVDRVALADIEVGQRVLLTDDRHASAAHECTGPWWPAAHAEGAVEAVVKLRAVTQGRDGDVVDLVTTVGEVRRVSAERSIALAA